MASKYTLLILLPAALLVVWFLLGLLRRKKPTRFALNNVLSLVLLAYFLAVTGTGIFWVAVQELPVFDWHYLPGYILLILGLLHVALHWKNVSLFLRRGAPKSLKTESGNFRGWIRGGGYALLAICIGVILFFIGAQHGARSITVVYSTPGEAQNDGDALHKPGIKKETMVEPTMIKSEGKTLPLAQYYHLGSAYPARSKLSGVTWKTRPALHKEYPGKAKVPLPVIKPDNGGSIIEAFNTWRKGNHRLEISSMTLDNLALLLYHTQGISKVLKLPGREFGLRTAPSAGALFPVNIYVAVNRVAGLDQGLYYYHVKDDSLIRLREGQTHHRLESVSGSPHLFRPAAATIIMTSTFGRSGFKYLERSYRYVNMDTGHAAY
ncbi:MAG: SagB/ThcOx family dehydrogenase, partial [bacterium]|nr:SagB/ThcOx family dehydrogenase [bacterium]